MPTGTISSTTTVAGLSIQTLTTKTASGALPGQEKSLPAGNAGSLTTRTDDDDGEITADSAEHTIETGDVVDVYWSGGIRYGMTVGTVDGTAIPVSGGAGDALPVADTDVVVTERVVLDLDFDGDKVEMIVATSTQRCHLDFLDSGDATLHAQEIEADESWDWVDGNGSSNPLTGNPVDELHVSNGSATAAATFKLAGLYNSDE